MRHLIAGLLVTVALACLPIQPAAADRDPVITAAERALIISFYAQRNAADADTRHRADADDDRAHEEGREHRGHGHGHRHSHKHGHGHAGSLPPGIARNLHRGMPLPPGIAMHRLPARLAARLPAPPRGYRRVVLDGRVLLIDLATRVIHDQLEDALIKD